MIDPSRARRHAKPRRWQAIVVVLVVTVVTMAVLWIATDGARAPASTSRLIPVVGPREPGPSPVGPG